MEDRMRQATHERQVRISRRKRSYELLASRAGYSPKGEPPNLLGSGNGTLLKNCATKPSMYYDVDQAIDSAAKCVLHIFRSAPSA